MGHEGVSWVMLGWGGGVGHVGVGGVSHENL